MIVEHMRINMSLSMAGKNFSRIMLKKINDKILTTPHEYIFFCLVGIYFARNRGRSSCVAI